LESYGKRKEESIRQAIATSQERGLPESRIRGFQTQLANHIASIESRRRELQKESKTRDEFREVAGVVCHLVN
jgi:hypothetical protein